MGNRIEEMQDTAWHLASKLGVRDSITEEHTKLDYGGVNVPLTHRYNHGRWQSVATPATFDELMQQVEQRGFVDITFPFPVEGECIELTDGDYKLVFVDQDGRADRVIKIFGWGGYSSMKAAETAARKIDGIYQVVQETTGVTILPYEVFAREDPQDGSPRVYEIQQRGLFAPPHAVVPNRWLPAVNRREREAFKLYEEVTMPRLFDEGLITKGFFSSRDTPDHLNMYLAYDLMSGQLVVKDVVDFVHA